MKPDFLADVSRLADRLDAKLGGKDVIWLDYHLRDARLDDKSVRYGRSDGGCAALIHPTTNSTPLERDDKNTIHVFGDYADVYDIRQAVEDGATRPLYYESRIVKLKVDEDGAKVAEDEVEYVVNADRDGADPDERIRV